MTLLQVTLLIYGNTIIMNATNYNGVRVYGSLTLYADYRYDGIPDTKYRHEILPSGAYYI